MSNVRSSAPPGLARAVAPLLVWIVSVIRPAASNPTPLSNTLAELASSIIILVIGAQEAETLAIQYAMEQGFDNSAFTNMVEDLAAEFAAEPEATDGSNSFGAEPYGG